MIHGAGTGPEACARVCLCVCVCASVVSEGPGRPSTSPPGSRPGFSAPQSLGQSDDATVASVTSWFPGKPPLDRLGQQCLSCTALAPTLGILPSTAGPCP